MVKLAADWTDIANTFRTSRAERLSATTIRPADFALLREAGFLRLSVPRELSGQWISLQRSGPQFAEIVRELARGDPSVALVAAMHPAVVAYWQYSATANPVERLSAQATDIYAQVLQGHWWGTLMSEPGSGGDVNKTRAVATEVADGFQLSGDKHFGSGSGQTSFMVTTARRDTADDSRVELFVIDMRDKAWTGEQGLTLLREWDGHGMCGTQSHAFTLTACPAQLAEPGKSFASALTQVSQISGVLFCAVIVGILDEAFAFARTRLNSKLDGMRPLERVELVKATNEHWQAQTLYRSARDNMGQPDGLNSTRQAKYAIATHAEQALSRLAKVVGGASFSRSSPLGQWGQDVKALGFLRPPWALQNDQLFDALL